MVFTKSEVLTMYVHLKTGLEFKKLNRIKNI